MNCVRLVPKTRQHAAEKADEFGQKCPAQPSLGRVIHRQKSTRFSSRQLMHHSLGHQSLHTRNGWSLIQLLLVISIIGVMTTVCVRLMSLLLRVERQSVGYVAQVSSLARLSRQFRNDVHAARECEPLQSADGPSVRLISSNGHLIIYNVQTRGVVRTEKEADRLIRRDLYRLSAITLTCEKPAGSNLIVTLVVGPMLTQEPPQAEHPPANQHVLKEFRVDARLSRDIAP